MTLYPVFLDLRDAHVVIVGGGPVAASKLDGLLAAGALVTVIAPEICDEIRSRDVRLIEREFVATDLDGRVIGIERDVRDTAIREAASTTGAPGASTSEAARPKKSMPLPKPRGRDDLVDVASSMRVDDAADAVDRTSTPDRHRTTVRQPDGARSAAAARPRWVVAAATPAVNREVAEAAVSRGVFVNAVDDKASATAYLGGVIRRGEVTVAISTGGIAPALAGLLREALDAVLPDDLDRWIDVARDARASWKRTAVPMPERRPLLLRALDRIYGGAA